MLNPLDFIPKWALLAALAAASAFGAWQWADSTYTNGVLSKERMERSQEDTENAQAARAKDKAERDKENQRNLEGQELADAFQKQIDARDTQLRAERAGGDRLRNDAKAFATRRGDPGETCAIELEGTRDRAATLGQLFSEADSFAGEMVDAAERHADEARTLRQRVEADRRH